MKLSKLLGVTAFAAALHGCVGNGSFKSEYTDYCSFEYTSVSGFYTADSLYFSTDFTQGPSTGTLAFHGKRNAEVSDIDDFKGGFMLSLLRDTVVAQGHLQGTNLTRSKHSVVADTTGANNSKGFAIFKYDYGNMPSPCVTFLMSQYEGFCLPRHMSVCNTNFVANSVTYGNGDCRAFQSGDYLKLIITGTNGGVTSGKAEFVLASCTDSGLNVVTTWKKFDLSDLGDFDTLDFTMESNVPGAPLQCCIDGLVVSVSVSG